MSLLRRIEKGGQQGGGGNQPSGGGAGGGDQGGDSRLDAMRNRRVSAPTGAAGASKDNYVDIKSRVQTKLLSELDPSMDTRSPEVRSTIEELFSTILAEENIVLSRAEKTRLFEQIARATSLMVACEPRRSKFVVEASRLLWAVRCRVELCYSTAAKGIALHVARVPF